MCSFVNPEAKGSVRGQCVACAAGGGDGGVRYKNKELICFDAHAERVAIMREDVCVVHAFRCVRWSQPLISAHDGGATCCNV